MTWLKSVAVTLLQWQMQRWSAHFYEDILEDDIQCEIPYLAIILIYLLLNYDDFLRETERKKAKKYRQMKNVDYKICSTDMRYLNRLDI